MLLNYLLVLCYCLLKQETTLPSYLNVTVSFAEFKLQKENYEGICAKKLIGNSSVANFKRETFEECISVYSNNSLKASTVRATARSQQTNLAKPTNPNFAADINFEFSAWIIFLIIIYSLTIFVAVFGKLNVSTVTKSQKLDIFDFF